MSFDDSSMPPDWLLYPEREVEVQNYAKEEDWETEEQYELVLNRMRWLLHNQYYSLNLVPPLLVTEEKEDDLLRQVIEDVDAIEASIVDLVPFGAAVVPNFDLVETVTVAGPSRQTAMFGRLLVNKGTLLFESAQPVTTSKFSVYGPGAAVSNANTIVPDNPADMYATLNIKGSSIFAANALTKGQQIDDRFILSSFGIANTNVLKVRLRVYDFFTNTMVGNLDLDHSFGANVPALAPFALEADVVMRSQGVAATAIASLRLNYKATGNTVGGDRITGNLGFDSTHSVLIDVQMYWVSNITNALLTVQTGRRLLHHNIAPS